MDSRLRGSDGFAGAGSYQTPYGIQTFLTWLA
jgi:hypothetical protein